MPWLDAQTDLNELKRCVRGFVTLSSLPTEWTQFEPVEIADSLAAALMAILDLEVVRISLGRTDNGTQPVVITRCRERDDSSETFSAALVEHLSEIGTNAALTIQNLTGGRMLRLAKEPIGVQDDAYIAAASSLSGFPTHIQRILLWLGAKEVRLALAHRDALSGRFAGLAERSADFIGIADVEGSPRYVNPAGCKMVGLSGVEEACRHPVWDFVMPEERTRLREALWPIVIKNGRWTGEIAFRHFRTGLPIPLLVDWFRVDDQRTASPRKIAMVSRNLSSQKMAEARLSAFNKELEASVNERTAALEKVNSKLVCETAERTRVDARLNELQAELFHASRLSAAGQMAAALADELNQPLAAAANFVNAARRMCASDTSHHTISCVLSEASGEVLRAGQIIHRLREFLARGDTERRVENVRNLIEDACEATSRTVHIVDDDPAVRRSLELLLSAAGFEPKTYSAAFEFFEKSRPLSGGCLLVDVRMPGKDGLELLAKLKSLAVDLPVIMMTAHGDIATAVRAMKEGAIDFLEKPFDDSDLIDALARALNESDAERDNAIAKAAEKVASLTSRERQVLNGLMAGNSNKGIARELQISVRTVEIHRAHMLERLGVRGLGEAVRLAVIASFNR